ncbi:MAG: hypothetical protein HRU41_25040 [Saprospiraceae bacterium]|nr:hypothetical protein [Saprospiraceae bacterium]
MRIYLILLYLALTTMSLAQADTIIALPNAHAHNDYEHKKPLFDALSNGFTSLEADVHLINGNLYVAHDPPKDLAKTPTLQSLYLEPLYRWIAEHDGRVYANYEAPIFLMIDIKTKAEPTYEVLKKTLAPFEKMLWHVENGKVKPGPVRVFLSGNRPIAMVQEEKKQLAGIDGRPKDIGKGYSADFMPVISDNYRRHLSWRGKKEGPKIEEYDQLKAWIEEAHREGKLVRLWASPENEAVWIKLRELGVDLLNTDHLSDLKNFLLNEAKK